MAGGGARRGNVVPIGGAEASGPRSSGQSTNERTDTAILNLLIGDAAKLARETERLGGPPQARALAYIAEDVGRGDLASAADRRDGIRRELRAATEQQEKRRKDRIVGWTIVVLCILGVVAPLLR